MPPFRMLVRPCALLLLALPGCSTDTFQAPDQCTTDCPLPPTLPPIVKFVRPVAGDSVFETTTLSASATDDRQVTGVEFFLSWIKLHPGTIGAPPYQMTLGKYYHDWPPSCPAVILLEVVAHDVEGNADTATTSAVFVPAGYDPMFCP